MANLPGSIKNLNTLLGEQLLEGGGSGGGGSSDFSTAEVTIKQSDTTTIPNVEDAGLANVLNFDEDIWVIGFSPIGGKPNIYTKTVVLYQSKTYLYDNQNNNVIESVSGNIAYNDDLRCYVITGDCTVVLVRSSAE